MKTKMTLEHFDNDGYWTMTETITFKEHIKFPKELIALRKFVLKNRLRWKLPQNRCFVRVDNRGFFMNKARKDSK